MVSLQVQIAKGPRGGGVYDAPFHERPLIINSARPEELPTAKKPAAEQFSYVHDAAIEAGGLGVGEALAGELVDNLFKTNEQRFAKYGEEKYNDALVYARRKNESSCYVFFGDDGHGDVAAAVLMLYDVPRMAHAFIHAVDFSDDDDDVNDDDDNLPLLHQSTGTVRDAIIFWRTAVGAALQAHCRGMINRVSLAIVVNSARDTKERTSCLKRCTPQVDEGCQALGPGPGYASGCQPLLYELALVDEFLDGKRDCNDTVPLVDATPIWIDPFTTARQPLYDDADTMAAHEATRTLNFALLLQNLRNQTTATVLTPDERSMINTVLRSTPMPVIFQTDDRTDNTFTTTLPSSSSSLSLRTTMIFIIMINFLNIF